MKRILISIVIVILFISTLNTASFASSDIKVNVDGKSVDFPDAKPFVDENGRTLIPIKFISEALGATISWSNQSEEVSINRGNTTVKLKIGDKNIIINGTTKAMDTKAIIKDSRTFVPARFVAEALDAKVEWNDKNNSVDITSGSSLTNLDPEYKTIIENVPGTFLSRDGIVIHSESGTAKIGDTNWTLSKDDKGGYTITVYKYESSQAFSSLELVLKQFYSKEYKQLYKDLCSIISIKTDNSNPFTPTATFTRESDNRHFSVDKYTDGVIIITIGK